MPLSSLSFERSVTALVTAFVKVPDHSEALTLWRQGGGGVWAISLASALDHLEATLTNPDRASRL